MQHPFLFGIIAAQAFVIALFFLKFWRKSHDRLFAIFSLAFLLLGLERVALVVFSTPDEPRSLIYLFRFFAFALISFGVLDKNRRSNTGK
jgi:hypothetical protein